ncbi:MAG: 50S ribosomal protein L4 [Actinobacteria bacterium]|nr:50S ribosomal protein L4 [Actinomycetota bacterium]
MPTVDVHTSTGDVTGSVDLDEGVFGAPVNVAAMHEVVRAQLAAARAGTAKVRNRAEVRGGGSKPWRQKGTGRARQGSIRAPQWAGGGVAHGPTGEQNHVKRVNRKLRRIALRSALSDRAASGDVRVIEGLAFDRGRTKAAAAVLDALGLAGRRVLLVLAGWDDDVTKSFRNLPDVHLLTVDQLNTYDVLRSDVVVFQRDALERIGTGRRADLPVATGAEGEDAP